VLRLLEVFRPEDVLAGVREAIARGAIGFDAVKLQIPTKSPADSEIMSPGVPK